MLPGSVPRRKKRLTMAARAEISVVIPTLNEEATIVAALASAGDAYERIVVDGGSSDRTREIAVASGARVIEEGRGRGRQLAAGARVATGEVLLFLHADTRLPAGFAADVSAVLSRPRCTWGRFDVRFDQNTPLLAAIARLISWRSRFTRGATGDQAIFVRASAYREVGGFHEDSLFEDVDLCRRLKRQGKMGVPARPVVTSSRRWLAEGGIRTSVRMWTLKALYLAGVPAARLERYYRDVR